MHPEREEMPQDAPGKTLTAPETILLRAVLTYNISGKSRHSEVS